MNPYYGKPLTPRELGETKRRLLKESSGRPRRETAINKDDILNLKIALHTANTVEEFINII